MISINVIKQEDLISLKESKPNSYNAIIDTIVNRKREEIDFKIKTIDEITSEVSTLEKEIAYIESTQDSPKIQNQHIIESSLKFPSVQLYGFWKKNNINVLCECRKRELGLSNTNINNTFVQRACCYGQEIGAY